MLFQIGILKIRMLVAITFCMWARAIPTVTHSTCSFMTHAFTSGAKSWRKLSSHIPCCYPYTYLNHPHFHRCVSLDYRAKSKIRTIYSNSCIFVSEFRMSTVLVRKILFFVHPEPESSFFNWFSSHVLQFLKMLKLV